MKFSLKLLSAGAAVSVLVLLSGCTSSVRPVADPNRSDLDSSQITELSSSKFNVPCRVEVHCPDSLVGQSDSSFSDYDFYHYPLQDILSNSMKSAAYAAFNQPGAEVVDAFTIYVTVPESKLTVLSDKALYDIRIIVEFREPGDKKVVAFNLDKHYESPFEAQNEVPPAVYDGARDMAYHVIKELKGNPRVVKTVRHFEDR